MCTAHATTCRRHHISLGAEHACVVPACVTAGMFSGICTRGGVCNARAKSRCVCGRLLARFLLLACMRSAQHRAQSRKHSDQCRHCACWYVCGCCCLCGGWLATLSRGVCHHDNHACWVIAGNQLICTATLPMFRSIHGRSGPHGSSGKAKAKNKTRHRFST